MPRLLIALLGGTLLVAHPVHAQAPAPRGELRWGGDAEGGAPFVEADPEDPSKVRGFDVEVAELLARGLGRSARFVQVAWSSIDASVARGDFDIGMSGVEDRPARRRLLAVTIPYFEFREVLSVRAADRARYTSLAALRGRRVGTLGSTQAYEILLEAASNYGIIPASYDDDVHPYTDLAEGRLDAVLLDHIIAARALRRTPGLVTQEQAEGTGHYVGVLAPGQSALRDRMDAILKAAMMDGRLERIYRKWNIWDDRQAEFFRRTLAGGAPKAGEDRTVVPGILESTRRYLPALFEASLVTIALSCLSMALAIAGGVLVATGRVYGGCCTGGL